MQFISLFQHKSQFLAFRDAVGKTLATDLSLPLKQRKLDEVVAHIVGAADFNTALGLLDAVPVAVAGDTCRKCGSLLGLHGFCIDDTCVYADWPQALELSEITNAAELCECDDCGHVCSKDALTTSRHLTERLEFDIDDPRCTLPNGDCPECGAFSYSLNHQKRIRVSAQVKSDDRKWSADFDAAPYFADALHKSIRHRAKHDPATGEPFDQFAALIKALQVEDFQRAEVADRVAEHFASGGPGYANVEAVFTYLAAADCGFEVSVDETQLHAWVRANAARYLW